MAKEKVEETLSLPYYATAEGILKLLAAITKKSGDENSIKNLFGEGKYNECKRALLFFGIINKEMTFSEFGKKLNYALDEKTKKQLWCDVIRTIQPYDNFLNYFVLNQKEQTECDIELVKKFWAQDNICKSDTMRRDAAVTFAYILSLAGLGEFKKGKQGNTRIAFSSDGLDSYMNNLVGSSVTVTEDLSRDSQDNRNGHEFLTNNIQTDLPLIKKLNCKTANGNIQVNINIDITVDNLDMLKEIMEYLKND